MKTLDSGPVAIDNGQMRVWYYQSDSGYIAITSQCPKGFRGMVFVGRGTPPGGGLDAILEQGYSADQIKRMTPVAKSAVPDEWMSGLGYEKPVPKAPPKPAAKPQAAPKPRTTVVVEEEAVFDEEGELLDLMPVRRRVYVQPQVGVEDPRGALIFLVGLIIGMVVVFWHILS